MTLKEARKKLELTQKQAATLLCVSISMYIKYETAGQGGRSAGYSIERASMAVRANYDRMMRDAALVTP